MGGFDDRPFLLYNLFGVAICWGGNLRIATANAVRYNKSANSEIGSPRTADFVGSSKQGDWQPKRAKLQNTCGTLPYTSTHTQE